MPINCPLAFSVCDSICGFFGSDRCNWFFPPMKFSELYTSEERLDKLEQSEPVDEPKWGRKQWDAVQQLRAEVVGWREKHYKALSEIDKLKANRGNKQRTNRYNKYSL